MLSIKCTHLFLIKLIKKFQFCFNIPFYLYEYVSNILPFFLTAAEINRLYIFYRFLILKKTFKSSFRILSFALSI